MNLRDGINLAGSARAGQGTIVEGINWLSRVFYFRF